MKKGGRGQEAGIPYLNLLIYLLCAYLVSAAILLVLALLLYKLNLSKEIISAGVTFTYVAAGFLAGFLAGKKMKQKKYIWGLFMGIAYYVILLLISLAVNHSVTGGAQEIFSTLVLCAGGGMLGGMLS